MGPPHPVRRVVFTRRFLSLPIERICLSHASAGVVAATLALVGTLGTGASAAVPAGLPQGLVTAAVAKHNITFGAAPANTTKPDGRTFFNFDASAGGRIDDHLAVLNLTRHAETLRVYTVDADPGANGGYVYPPRTAQRVGAGAWVAVGTPHAAGVIRAAARSTTILPIRLQVPANASPGDHAAAVIVSLTALVKGKSGQRLHLEQRVATRVLVRVAGVLRPQLAIDNLQASYSGSLNPIASGRATVTYTVRNTGNAILSGTQAVTIEGLFRSTTHATGLPPIPTLLPGGSYTSKVNVPGVFPEIRMTAKVAVTPKALGSDVDTGLSPVTASTHFWAVPWILIAIILLLALGVWLRRRWRRRRASAPAAPATAPADPQSIGGTQQGVQA